MSRSHSTSSHRASSRQPSPETPRSAGATSDHVDPAPSEEETVACSRALARQHRVVPLRQEGDTLVIGAARPVSPAVRNEIAFATGHAIAVERVADERVVAYFGPDDHTPEATSPDESSDPSPKPEASEAKASEAGTPEASIPEAAALETATPEPGTPNPANGGANGGDMPPDNRQQQDHPTERKQTADKQAKAKQAKGPSAEQGAPRQAAASRRLQDLRVEGSAPQQVHQIIQGAIACGASDIHIEPYAETYRVRYRLDGVLHEVVELALRRQPELTARIKIMAELDIAEKRRPQDGRITVRPDRQAVQQPGEIDLRVSTLPTAFGEKVVLRVLDRSDITLDLEALGFAEADRTAFEQAIHRPHGMVLVTGPTGSGKTTTLYAALQAVANERLNVQTIEDPIEYEIPGINQAQARPDIGFAFADALRAFLRQDPDVIMVGEIRDQETAQIAIRAALTGHLVLSTLHTNDAPSAPGRLIDMGVPPYLVASSVTLIMAQRLVRTICPECATARPISDEQREALGLSSSACTGQHGTGQHGTGCPACHDTGFKGRTAVSYGTTRPAATPSDYRFRPSLPCIPSVGSAWSRRPSTMSIA